MSDSATPRRRIEAIDVARGAALVAMASFHLSWDLEFFGYLPPGTTGHGLLKLYARAIASSFLFLVGVSLVLANRDGVRWRSFRRRFAAIAGAAGLITLGTFVAMRDEFIFFGILHEIALASLVGLAFLRLPPLAALLAAALVIAAPHYLRSPAFDHPGLWWVGLSTVSPRSNDYVPVFPWLGPVLIGIAAGGWAGAIGLWRRVGGWRPRRLKPLAFLGRHSLAFYLLHQPLLLGALWLFALLVPAEPVTPAVRFRASCEASCLPVRGEAFCARYCACMLDNVETAGLMDEVFGGTPDDDTKARINSYAGLCDANAEDGTGQ